jgi:hypothetical protein
MNLFFQWISPKTTRLLQSAVSSVSLSCVFITNPKKISEQPFSNGEPIRHTVLWEGIRTTHETIPMTHTRCQKSAVWIPLTCSIFLSFHVSKRHIVPLPCLFRVWEGRLYLAKSSLLGDVPIILPWPPFSVLGNRNFFSFISKWK